MPNIVDEIALNEEREAELARRSDTGSHRGDSNFLYWIRDRLVHVYHEHPHTDYIIRLEELAKKMPNGRISNHQEFLIEDIK